MIEKKSAKKNQNKKQWLAKSGSRLAKNGSGSQAHILVNLIQRTGSVKKSIDNCTHSEMFLSTWVFNNSQEGLH